TSSPTAGQTTPNAFTPPSSSTQTTSPPAAEPARSTPRWPPPSRRGRASRPPTDAAAVPELPEVEVVRAGLAPAVTDASIASVTVLDERSLRRHDGPAE